MPGTGYKDEKMEPLHLRGFDCPGESQTHSVINLTIELGKDYMALSGGIREGFTEEVTLEPRPGESVEFRQLDKDVAGSWWRFSKQKELHVQRHRYLREPIVVMKE